MEALTKRKTVTVNDKLILPYRHSEVGSGASVQSLISVYFLFIRASSCWCVLGFFLPLTLCIAPSFIFHQAITARDSMAKSLYSALFDWIVLRINHALLNKKDMEESVPVRNTHIRKCKDMKSPVTSPPFVPLALAFTWRSGCFPVLIHRCPGHFWLRGL